METEAIPQQKKGSSFDVRESVIPGDREEAVIRYTEAKNRLLSVSQWGEFAGEAADTFVLTDKDGNDLNREAQEGDLVKIHLPGPRNLIGGGEDWVLIEKIYEERNKRLDEIFTAITIRPNLNPAAKNPAIAHFFGKYTTNTFLVCRHKMEIVSSIHGRNEQTNTDTDWLDVIRNLMIAIPAKVGLSNAHWKRLAKGLICGEASGK
ncbi:MAG: hypothetical protein ACHQHN_16440 [Sphingobacteriales bacterium]